jgi:Family of unknown function (DUF6931)
MALFSRPATPLPKLTTSSAADLAAKSNADPASKALIKPGMSSSEYVHALEQNKQSVDAVKALAHGMPEQDSVCWACKSSQQVGDKLNPEEKAATQAAEAWVKNPTEANKAAAAAAASKTDFKGPGGWAAQAAAWSKAPAKPAAGMPAAEMPAAQMPAMSKPSVDSLKAAGLAKAGTPAVPAQGLPRQTIPGQEISQPQMPTEAPSLTAAAVTGAVMLAAGLLNGKPMSAPQKPNLESVPASKPTPNIPTDSAAQLVQVDQSKMSKSLQPFIDNGKKIASGEIDCQKG